jgi:hypothetical protein
MLLFDNYPFSKLVSLRPDLSIIQKAFAIVMSYIFLTKFKIFLHLTTLDAVKLLP